MEDTIGKLGERVNAGGNRLDFINTLVVTGSAVPRVVYSFDPKLDRSPNDRVIIVSVDNRTADVAGRSRLTPVTSNGGS